MTIQVILWSGEWCISFFSHRSAISFCGDRRWALREHLLSAYPGGLSTVTWGHLQVGYRNVKKQCAAFVCVCDIYIYIHIFTSSGSFWNPETASTWLRQHSYQNPPKPRAPRINTTEPWFLGIFDDMISPGQVRPHRLIMLLGIYDRIFRTEWFRGPWPGTKQKHEKNELHCESLAVKLPLFLSLVWCFDVHWYFCYFC